MRPLAAASVLALIAGSALAQVDLEDASNLVRTRDITGGNIYTVNPADDELSWDADTAYDRVGDGWNDVGEIEDLILDRQGALVAIVAEVGGFLDIGDKHVLLPVEDVRLVPSDDDEFAYVTRYSEEQLEELPDVDEGFWD